MAGFQIYNASAGSGKTYQLTKSYLCLVLSEITPRSFGQILALTFTNKAVDEMKNRILDSLFIFGNPDISKEKNALFNEVKDLLGVSPDALQEKAALALKLILHNYNFFDVSTIDKFTHRVIKTFAKDLSIAQNFAVELDAEVLLDEAIGRLLQKLKSHKDLQKVLIDFALEKVEAQKSWNIVLDLKQTGKLHFSEKHYKRLQALKSLEIKDFTNVKTTLANYIKEHSALAVQLGQEALTIIYDQGFEDADFSRGTLPNHFKKIVSGETSLKPYSTKLEEGLQNGSLHLKKVQKDTSGLYPLVLEKFLAIKELLISLNFYQNAYQNLLPLTVLNEVSKEINAIQKERDLLHISEFNKLIAQEVADQPVPFIYERLGERYRHYFLDEFQDTSVLQWQNIVPLIGNALESLTMSGAAGSLLLVGDPKQSIYRWRGGDPEQFINLNNGSKTPFSITPSIQDLDTNWRSFDTIVHFNNTFFQYVATSLSNPAHQELYAAHSFQKTTSKEGGMVSIEFAPKNTEDLSLFYCEAVLKTLKNLFKEGREPNEICILVRKNKEGILLADFLAAHSIPLVSSESLLLASNPEVQFLIALLRFLNDPQELLYQFQVLFYLFKEQHYVHDPLIENLSFLSNFLKEAYGYKVEEQQGLAIYTILENAISCFKLKEKSGAHIFHLLDVALEVSQSKGVSLQEFLTYWDLKSDQLAVAAPSHINAVQLMTIHKSKGLEFPIVLFPFADLTINDPRNTDKLWVPVASEIDDKFPYLLVNANQTLEHFSKSSNTIYANEKALSELDDINILYVAMTRAIEGIYVFTKNKKGQNYGQLFKTFLEESYDWKEDQEVFTQGYLQKKEVPKETNDGHFTIPYIYSDHNLNERLSITSQASWAEKKQDAINWGNLIHDILAHVNRVEDISTATDLAEREGTLSPTMREQMEKTLHKILAHPELKNYYGQGVRGLNEIELLDENGDSYRPDRLVLEKGKAILIDYKTGVKKAQHKKQLEAYCMILEKMDMNLVVAHKILVYIGKDIEPVFI